MGVKYPQGETQGFALTDKNQTNLKQIFELSKRY